MMVIVTVGHFENSNRKEDLVSLLPSFLVLVEESLKKAIAFEYFYCILAYVTYVLELILSNGFIALGNSSIKSVATICNPTLR
jgi:type III secretory pathway component EscR